MTDAAARSCRTCGGPIAPTTNTRGGRPREHCHTCRPSQAAARRRWRDHEQLTALCRRCGQPVDHTRSQIGRRKTCCHACAPSQFAPPAVELADLLTAPDTTQLQRSVLSRAADLAEAGGWPPKAVGTLLVALRQVLTDQNGQQRIGMRAVHAALPSPTMRKVAASALNEHEILDDDSVPSIQAWIERKSDKLPDGFSDGVRAWLLELHAGGDRFQPRSRSTLYAYFGRVRPHLVTWSRTYDHLREVTEQDVIDVLDSTRGHQRTGTFTSLRSLFRFAQRHRLVFTDPTRRLHVGRSPNRSVLPMSDEEVAAVKRAAVTSAQQLVVALVAVHAVRAAAVRHLMLDDIDLRRRHLRIGGTTQPMPELVHRVLREWLAQRRRRWPHTPNPHVLLSNASAAGTEPVSDYYLSWHLAMQDVPLEHLRADRVLHEAVAVNADPLHLTEAFGLRPQTAIEYSTIACNLLERPVEQQAPRGGR